MRGIDVSKYQGTIDWQKVDVDFVIIRAGLGNTAAQIDKKFTENVKGALSRGLHVGAYWFSYAISVEDARKEAEACKQVLAPYKGKIDFPVAFDYEYDSIKYAQRQGINPTNALIDSMARAFMDSMRSDGWFVNLYTNIDFIRSGKFSADTIKKYDVWLADYSGGPDYPCGIQQTGSTGRVNGIAGNVDTNVAFKDYPAIIKAGGYNGYPKPQSTAVNIDTTMDVAKPHGGWYKVKCTSAQQPSLTFGTGGVVTILPPEHTENDWLYYIVAVGQAGQETGIFTTVQGEKPLRRFKFKIN